MEINALFESRAVSLSDCASDPEEQEVSDDDDDCNHKHRRRVISSQSMEGDQQEQFFNRPYRKRGRPFDNAYLSKESNSQSHYSLDREFPSRFEKRRPSMTNFSRFPLTANQRLKTNPSFSGDLGSNRGRTRDFGPWSHNDSSFHPFDIASQMVPPMPIIPPAVFASRGFHSVADVQNAPWGGGFGLIPGVPNGAIDPIHPLGLQGSLRSPLNPSLNIGVARQHCRDFEERGFCLRGDMCPMEHGVNRIVVEDVQSLSQFNLPVSLPSAHLLANSGGKGLDPHVNSSPSVLINNNGPGIDADIYCLSGALSGVVEGCGADKYDPDQPLWNNDCSQTSTGLLSSQTPASFMESDPSAQQARSSGAAIGLQSTSSPDWGRVSASKNRLVSGAKLDCRVTSSEFSESIAKEKREIYANNQRAPHHGKRSRAGELVDSSFKLQRDTGYSIRKPAQKAVRSVFVSCIPLKDNKIEALLAHFKKFGEVIDIYIPPNTEQAFVQFSKREEAERALKSPDAVMGNRFIKLLWANRDKNVDSGGFGGNNMSGMPNHIAPHRTTANASKDNIQLGAPKAGAPYTPDCSRTVSSEVKPPTSNGPKELSAAPVQKKLENLELLKEELRKKQGMLEQKRNEFRQQLNKLQKNATGIKGGVPEVQASKKLKVEGADDSPKSGTPKHSNLHRSSVDMLAEGPLHKSQPLEIGIPDSPKTKFPAMSLELSNLKHVGRPLAYVGSPYPTNRYKLDNRPTSFRVNAPLPTDFANVNAVRGHFVVFGDLSNVDLEHSEVQGGDNDNCSETAENISARVSFKTRQAAERAFMNGKSWNGHSLQLTWLMPTKFTGSPKDKSPAFKRPLGTELKSLEKPPASTNPPDSSGERGSSASAAKEASGTETQSMEKSACDVSHDSCGGSQSSAPGLASFPGAEAQSADKSSVVGSSHESSERGSTDSEVVGKGSSVGRHMESDENPPQLKTR